MTVRSRCLSILKARSIDDHRRCERSSLRLSGRFSAASARQGMARCAVCRRRGYRFAMDYVMGVSPHQHEFPRLAFSHAGGDSFTARPRLVGPTGCGDRATRAPSFGTVGTVRHSGSCHRPAGERCFPGRTGRRKRGGTCLN